MKKLYLFSVLIFALISQGCTDSIHYKKVGEQSEGDTPGGPGTPNHVFDGEREGAGTKGSSKLGRSEELREEAERRAALEAEKKAKAAAIAAALAAEQAAEIKRNAAAIESAKAAELAKARSIWQKTLDALVNLLNSPPILEKDADRIKSELAESYSRLSSWPMPPDPTIGRYIGGGGAILDVAVWVKDYITLTKVVDKVEEFRKGLRRDEIVNVAISVTKEGDVSVTRLIGGDRAIWNAPETRTQFTIISGYPSPKGIEKILKSSSQSKLEEEIFYSELTEVTKKVIKENQIRTKNDIEKTIKELRQNEPI